MPLRCVRICVNLRNLRVLFLLLLLAGPADSAEIIEARKIWDQAPHNAFTSLVRFRKRWFCSFREGKAHVSPDGAIRVITSSDGRDWESAARLSSATADLRDPKLSITPDKRLMLTAAGALHQPAEFKHQTFAWFSRDGHTWTEPQPIGEPNFWLWRVTWHGREAYGVGYDTAGRNRARLYVARLTADGFRLTANRALFPPAEGREPTADRFFRGFPNEASIIFLKDGTALCLLRRDGDPATAQLGQARPPYRDWAWQDIGVRVGGPNFICLPDGRIAAAVRLYDGKVRTALCWLDPRSGRLTEFLTLPSGGDTSYAGLVWHDRLLWVSYYSSHEGKTSIYLAKVKLGEKTGTVAQR